MFDFDFLQAEQITLWLLTSGVHILLIVVLAYLSSIALRTSIRYAIRRIQALDGEDGSDFDKRVETVFSVIKRSALASIIIVAILMVLQELGADIRPLLASVGVVGLALGLGAQSLFKDVISGLFILAENHYQVGDIIEVGGRIGTVERMSLRVTRIRDVYGVIHVIPNGEIRTVSNRTRDWSRAVIDLGITYEDDVELTMQTLEEIGEAMSQEPTIAPFLIETPTVLGIESLDDWQVKLRIMVKTLPNQQFTVQRYLRRQIQRRFADKGINLALPRQEVMLLQPEAIASKIVKS